MKKDNLMNIYYKMCVFIGAGALLSLFLYLKEFPKEMNGDIIKTFFSLEFDILYETNVVVFNTILIIFFIVFLINLGALIFALVGEKLEGLLLEAAFYNTIITFLLVVSHLAFYLQIPSIVNGEISHSVFHSNFYSLTDVRVIVFNFSYLFIAIYLFYNAYVIYNLLPQNKKLGGKTKK